MKNPHIARAGFLVTPSDSADLSADSANTENQPNCVLHIGGSGALKVTTEGGSTLTFTAVGSGFFPVSVKRVFSTGTTATSIHALYDDLTV